MIVFWFQAAYAIGLLACGPLIDRVGSRMGYAAAITLWSFAALAHVLVRSPGGFSLMRFALGLGEAANFPAAIKSVAEWFPKKERALAADILNAEPMSARSRRRSSCR
jgi:ACS family hexuronate transporter-like MFS transporter